MTAVPLSQGSTQPMPRRATQRSSWLRPQSLRMLHTYCAALSAPMMLFFALSGMLQLFDFHKARLDTGYRPPPILLAIGELHKNQTADISQKTDDASPPKPHKHDADAGNRARAPKSLTVGQLLLKWYAVMASTTFVVTALVGLYMSVRLRGDKKAVLASFLIGIFLPLAILLVIP